MDDRIRASFGGAGRGKANRPLLTLLFAAVSAIPLPARAQLAQEPLLAARYVAPDGALVACQSEAASSLSFPATSVSDGALVLRSGYRAATWEGVVKAYDAQLFLDFAGAPGSEPDPIWVSTVPRAADRNIFTSAAQDRAVPFAWCSLIPGQRMLLDAAYAAANPCPAAAPAILDYLRGEAAGERRNGGSFRDRPATVIGDVVNSSPLYSHAQDHGYQVGPAASRSASGAQGHSQYRAYVDSKRSARLPTVMFGANDGMFHVLDARRGQPTSGREVFAYVPRAAFPLLPLLADPAYTHRYSVDGPVVESDVWTGSAWKTIAIGTTGAGPPGIFAIDVTAPGPSMDGRNVLWDVTADDHPSAEVRSTLGRTLGAGVIGSVKLGSGGAWAYIVGNGYESRRETAVLLVFNALDGSLVRAIDTGVGSPGVRNGLGALTPVFDGSRNIVAVYAGDKLGNLWKFDLGSSTAAEWGILNQQPAGVPRPLFSASQDGVTRPIHQAPRVMPHPRGGLAVAIGTGKFFDEGDRESGDEQGIFVLQDAGGIAPIQLGDLQLIRTEEYSNGAEVFRRLYRPDLANYDASDKGFWVRLRSMSDARSTERVIGPLILDAGVLVVSTFAPAEASETCTSGGWSYVYRIDIATAFSRGSFGAEDGATVARRLEGPVLGVMPLHRPGPPSGETVRSLSAADLATLMGSPRYRAMPDGSLLSAQAGSCLLAGVRLNGSLMQVETRCAGVLPLRSWRPMK